MWVRAMVQAMPHGGKAEAAELLGLSPSGMSKLLNNPERGFDEKTLNAVAWSLNSKAAKWPEDRFPVISRVTVGPIVIEMRKGEHGNTFPVWRPTAELKPKK